MSERPTPPRQVLFATWVAGGAGLAMLLSAGDLASRLRTVDLRESLAAELAKGWDQTLPLNVDQLLEVLKVVLLVCGAAAAAVVVLAFFLPRRDNRARIGLSACAVPLFLGGLAVSPIVSGLIAVAVVLLWTQPASGWFVPRAATAGAGSASGPPMSVFAAPAPVAAARPRPPRQVILAVVVTFLVSGLVALTLGLGIFEVFQPGYRAELEKLRADNPQVREAGITVEAIATIAAVLLGLLVVWALVAMVLAALTLAGHGWARIALVISAGAAALLGLPASLVQPGFLLVVAAGAYVAILLVQRDTTVWLERKKEERRLSRGGS